MIRLRRHRALSMSPDGRCAARSTSTQLEVNDLARLAMRVLVAVPAEVERAGLILMVQDAGHHVVGEAADAQSALALAEERAPDVAIVDSTIPDVPALGLVHFLMQRCPGLQVLLYTDRCHRDWMEAALREGVRAFVLKRQVGNNLSRALCALSDHRPYWEDAVDDDVLDDLLGRGPRPPPNRLTSREWQVLQMAAEERTAKEMARAIGVSPRTVETFRTSLRRKLCFRSKADLHRYVAQREVPPG